MSKPKQSNPLAQAWLVLLLALLYGGGLAFVHTTLSPKIAENIKNETYSLIPTLVGDPEQYSVDEISMPLADGQTTTIYHVTDGQSNGIGWVVPASALGFAEKIQLLVGVDNNCSKIIGMRVIDQKETPGLGNLIIKPAFTNQFADKRTDSSIKIVKMTPSKSNEVRAVTGATISSVTVADAINEAMLLAKPFIQQALKQ